MSKKKIGLIIFFVVCAIFVAVCLAISFVMNKQTEELEKEAEKYETLVTTTKSGEQVETQYIHVGEEKFFVKVPTAFKQLDSETINQKYSGDVPDIVFSNDEVNINVAISMSENEMHNVQINSFGKQMEESMKSLGEIISTNYYTVDGHDIAQLKLVSNAEDTKIYNNMVCFSYNDKLVIITFNCTEALRDEWVGVGDFIIDSIFFTDNNN